MESWHWAIALRPFFAVAVLLITGMLIVYPLRRWLPDGKLKQALLWRTTRAKGWKQHLLVTAIILAPFVFAALLVYFKYPDAY